MGEAVCALPHLRNPFLDERGALWPKSLKGCSILDEQKYEWPETLLVPSSVMIYLRA